MNPEDITSAHRLRLACVYVRQSSEHQVLHHRESQRRQRSLVDRAFELGWSRELVVTIDEDLGQSAGRSNERHGFEDLVSQVARGEVGLILALEVSRLTRGSSDWYRLLDICAITGTLIADAEGLYDPRSYNDRLLLGLKGTMSEAELHMMKQRMAEATLAKARRGELRRHLPPGYVWDEADRMQKVADEQVRSAIEHIFERFEQLGTIHQVHSALVDEGFRVPSHNRDGKRIRWNVPDYGYLHRMLRSPIYGGAYVYGQRQVEEVLDESMRPVKRMRPRAREDWHALIEGHHEGYISWERFERNQRQIESNRKGSPGPGAPREGRSLLQGLVLCGRCGRRMRVMYSGLRKTTQSFSCAGARRQTGGPICQSFGGLGLERAVEGLVLEALAPLGLDAMTEAAAAQVRASESERLHWEQRVERARYEVDLARRGYDEVDPANRLVARELERRWEEALEALQRTERDAEEAIRSLETPLSGEDKERLQYYAQDLPSLWGAPTTRPQDRKRIVRLLIEQVIVRVSEDDATLEVKVHWSGGEVSKLSVAKVQRGKTRHVAPSELIDLIRTLAREFSDSQIARIFNRRGIRTPKGLTFTANRVAVTRNNHGIEKGSVVPRQGEDIYSATQASELLGVTPGTAIRWVEAGLLKGAQLTEAAPWRIQVTAEDIERLRPSEDPEGWVSLKKAAQALGMSQQGVLQKLNRGELEGARVQRGRRPSWRIRLPASTYDPQPTLFGPTGPGTI